MPATLLIDEEFQNLTPPLTDEEFSQLESNILRDGIQDPLKIWRGTIVDGHNRFKIAQKHALDFRTTELSFADRNDAIIWIIKNQFGRRNLSAYDRSVLALKLKPAIAAKAKQNQGERTDILQKSAESLTPIDTRLEVATVAGVSHDTIAKVEKINAEAPPELIAALRASFFRALTGDHEEFAAVTAEIGKFEGSNSSVDAQVPKAVKTTEYEASGASEGKFEKDNYADSAVTSESEIRAGVQNYLDD